MLQRSLRVAMVCTSLFLCAQPARAQQTLNFTLGYFSPLSESARVTGDVLNVNETFLVFDVGEFGGATIGGEYLIPIGSFLEAGAGVSFSRQTVPTVYRDFVDSDGTELDQDLRLRLVPMAFTVRVLPFGQSTPIQPYFGGGLGLINWRYEESGEFIDFNADREIFEDTFVASGTEPGAVFLGGVRFAGERVSAGGEIRYQHATADLPSDFAGPRIDLGGWTYNLTVGVRF